jgi:RND superfamily putative drug exporter
MLAFVILLTFLLLMRAFRSVFLPFKAVVLNLVSLGAAFGIIVFVFQEGTAPRRSGACTRRPRSSPGSR